jgi:hypothetical protein
MGPHGLLSASGHYNLLEPRRGSDESADGLRTGCIVVTRLAEDDRLREPFRLERPLGRTEVLQERRTTRVHLEPRWKGAPRRAERIDEVGEARLVVPADDRRDGEVVAPVRVNMSRVHARDVVGELRAGSEVVARRALVQQVEPCRRRPDLLHRRADGSDHVPVLVEKTRVPPVLAEPDGSFFDIGPNATLSLANPAARTSAAKRARFSRAYAGIPPREEMTPQGWCS